LFEKYNSSNTTYDFSLISLEPVVLAKIKSGEPVDLNQLSARVTPTGFKPVTLRAEI
jgi:hypothetical protein